jgi:hypothetical protein
VKGRPRVRSPPPGVWASRTDVPRLTATEAAADGEQLLALLVSEPGERGPKRGRDGRRRRRLMTGDGRHCRRRWRLGARKLLRLPVGQRQELVGANGGLHDLVDRGVEVGADQSSLDVESKTVEVGSLDLLVRRISEPAADIVEGLVERQHGAGLPKALQLVAQVNLLVESDKPLLHAGACWTVRGGFPACWLSRISRSRNCRALPARRRRTISTNVTAGICWICARFQSKRTSAAQASGSSVTRPAKRGMSVSEKKRAPAAGAAATAIGKGAAGAGGAAMVESLCYHASARIGQGFVKG